MSGLVNNAGASSDIVKQARTFWQSDAGKRFLQKRMDAGYSALSTWLYVSERVFANNYYLYDEEIDLWRTTLGDDHATVMDTYPALVRG